MMLISVFLMCVLGGVEVDLFVPSFPELQHDFFLSPFGVEMLLSANLISYCVSCFLLGALSDQFGRRPIIIAGLIIFIIGSILCAFAPFYSFLIVGRIMQGIGVAAPATLSILIVADLYTVKKTQHIMGIMNGLITLSMAAAPVIGCYITMHYHWQGNFITLLLLGIACFIMAVLYLPKHKLTRKKETLSLSAFIPIFRNKELITIIIATVFVCAAYWIFIGIAPVLYMKNLGISLKDFGYYQGFLAVIFGTISLLSGTIIEKFGQQLALKISLLICLLGSLILTTLTVNNCSDPVVITATMAIFSAGVIMPVNILYPLALSIFPEAKGRVTALWQSSRLIITAIGLQTAGYFYNGSFQIIGIILLSCFVIAFTALTIILINKAKYGLILPEENPA